MFNLAYWKKKIPKKPTENEAGWYSRIRNERLKLICYQLDIKPESKLNEDMLLSILEYIVDSNLNDDLKDTDLNFRETGGDW